MNDFEKKQLREMVQAVVMSCKGTTWESESLNKLRFTLKAELRLRDSLIDQLIAS